MSRFIGTKKFYLHILAIALPIMVQNAITNFVNLLDNIMVGQVGTDQMSGVAIVNQLIFVYNLAIFGGLSGAGIFTTQYYGKEDHDGIRNTFRFKLLISILLLGGSLLIFLFGGTSLVKLFLHEGSQTGDLMLTLKSAQTYLKIMLIGLVPFTLNQCYVSTLRETGKTVAPMTAGILSVIVNLFFNYVLIFGNLGAPRLGVTGAAIATVISRFVETIVIIVWTHSNHQDHPYMVGLYRTLSVPKALVKKILVRGTPLMVNEILWASSITALNRYYSTHGLATVAAINICNTINNVFNVVFIALGCSVAIIVGQLLGSGKMEEARDTDTKMIAFSVVVCIGIGGIMAHTAPLFPQLYKTTDEVRSLATYCIRVMACLMPFCAFTHASYFTLRAGGQTWIAFLFDSAYMWVIAVPVAFLLSRTSLSIFWMYGICQSLEITKCIMGYLFVKQGKWITNIIKE